MMKKLHTFFLKNGLLIALSIFSSLEAGHIQMDENQASQVSPSSQCQPDYELKSIRDLLPGVKDLPDLKLNLPSNFESIPLSYYISESEGAADSLWGPKDIIKGASLNEAGGLDLHVTTPILYVLIDKTIKQTGPISFSIEDELRAKPKLEVHKILWGKFPVLIIINTNDQIPNTSAIIGLNNNSQTLCIKQLPTPLSDLQAKEGRSHNFSQWMHFTRGPYGKVAYICEEFNTLPTELAVLKRPKNWKKSWKLLSQSIEYETLTTKIIPINQDASSCTDLLLIRYKAGDVDTATPNYLNNAISKVKNYTRLSKHKKNNLKILEKSKDSLLYEEQLYGPYGGSPIGYKIERMFVKKNGIHQISYLKKDGHPSHKEKEEWIKTLKEDTCLLNFDEAAQLPDAISLIETSTCLYKCEPD